MFQTNISRIQTKNGGIKGDIYMKINIKSEDKETIMEFGIALLLSGVLIVGIFFMMTFIFFYGPPWIIPWSLFLIMLKLRICDTGLEVSLEKFLHKYLKISVTIV